MNKLLDKKRIKGGTIQYATAIATGLANFFALKILQHGGPDASSYSQLSTLLLSFTTFQILTDLGTQTEFLRTFHSADKSRQTTLIHQLLQTRLLLGFVLLIIASIYAVSVDFSAEMTKAFLIYQLAFIPFAFMSVADSIFAAQFEFEKAIFSRITRLFAIFLFLIAAVVSPNSNAALIGSALISTAVFFISAFITWYFVLRRLMRDLSAKYRLLSWKWWILPENEGILFLKGSAVAGLFILLLSTQSFVAQGFLVKTVGEESLSDFNTSVALATPALLALQTITQMHLPSIAHWTSSPQKIIYKKVISLALQLGAASLALSGALWIAHTFGLVKWFFPLSHSSVVQLSLLGIAAHTLLNLYGPVLTLCQYKKRVNPLLWAVITSILCSWIVQYSLSNLWPEAALLGAFLLFASMTTFFGIFLLKSERN